MSVNKAGSHYKNLIQNRGKVVNKQGLVINNLNLRVRLEDKISSLLAKKRPLKVLDVGCGQGLALNDLAAHVAKKGNTQMVELFGVDIEKQGKKHDFMYVVEDVEEYDFPVKFDLIFSHQTIQYIPDKLKVITKAYNWLSPIGEAYLYIYNKTMFVKENDTYVAFSDSKLLRGFVKTGVAEVGNTRKAVVLYLKKKEFFPEIAFGMRLNEQKTAKDSTGRWISYYD